MQANDDILDGGRGGGGYGGRDKAGQVVVMAVRKPLLKARRTMVFRGKEVVLY